MQLASDLEKAVEEHERRYATGRFNFIKLKGIASANGHDTKKADAKTSTPGTESKGVVVYQKHDLSKTRDLRKYVETHVRGFDSMPPGSTALMSVGEADPRIWGHPLILEAIYRGAKPLDMLMHHYNRGTAMFTQGRYEAALYDFQYFDHLVNRLGFTPAWLKSLRQEAGDTGQRISTGYLNYGATLQRLGRPIEAISILVKASSYDPSQKLVRSNLGIIFEEVLRDMPMARNLYKQELALHPDNATARVHLNGLPKISAGPGRSYL